MKTTTIKTQNDKNLEIYTKELKAAERDFLNGLINKKTLRYRVVLYTCFFNQFSKP